MAAPLPPLFSWELCADLHNRILDIGWEAVTKETGWEPNTDSWWEYYFCSQHGEEHEEDPEKEDKDPQMAEELQRRLHQDIIKFLKKARHDYAGTQSSCHFFYYLKGLVAPRHMIKVLNNDEDTGLYMFQPQQDQYVYLYNFTDSVIGGLLLDQQTRKVAILLDHDAYAFATDPPIWTPLEDILLSFVGMVEQKRVLAVSICSEFDSPEEPKDGFWEEPIPIFTPWALSNDDDQIVDVTISAWHSLLSAIESRIPGPTDNEYKTYDDEHINLCDLYGHFIKKFLQKARIPNFQFVAPGLRLSLPEELAAQPFKGFVPPPPQNLNLNLPQIPSSGLPQISIPQLPNYNRPQDPNQIRNPWDMAVYEYKWYPFLFLRANKKVPKAEGKYNDYPWENASEFSTGLYLINTKTIEKADGCKLLLPFPINSRAFSKFGDEKGIDDVRKNDGLYQPGESLIIRDDKLRLELLFKNWTSMIENGHWEVDENGVVGGIEKFREADTEEKWNLYWIERTW